MYRLLAALLVCASAFAAEDPVSWKLTLDSPSARPGAEVLARLTGTIQEGWHLYSLSTPKGGPNPTTLAIADNPGVEGFRVFQPNPERRFDPNFQLDTETFAGQVVFLVAVRIKRDAPTGPAELTAQTRYQSCTDKICLPPKRKSASASLSIDPGAKETAVAIPAGYDEFRRASPNAARAATTAQPEPAAPPAGGGLARFLLLAFGAGLAAIFTPCVFPMIPFTVSYFLRGKGVSQALVFCFGIIVLFTGIGLLVKAIAGPFGIVQLGNSPWVNGFIALVFVIFGLSLLGAYELTLPSGLLTRLDQASQRGGYAGTLLMGLTFSLTSFACVGPFVGPLLAASVQGGAAQPVLGMLCFATGLATPFFFLALFPSYLNRLPKSGNWLMRVKVVFGFIILAAAVEYLSKVDLSLQKNLISRELFLAAWVVLFALPGLYLLGFLRLEGVDPESKLGVGRTLCAAAFLIFALSLLPGMFGAALGDLEAYVPQPRALGLLPAGTASGPKWLKNQYREALERARNENKLVFVNFTGYACTNCHWMKANMFPRPEIVPLLDNFVLVDLYTDGTDSVSEANQKLEESRFHTVAIPFYAILDPSENVIATFPGLTKDAQQFAGFLKSGGGKQLASSRP